jgi:hypothetical protein
MFPIRTVRLAVAAMSRRTTGPSLGRWGGSTPGGQAGSQAGKVRSLRFCAARRRSFLRVFHTCQRLRSPPSIPHRLGREVFAWGVVIFGRGRGGGFRGGSRWGRWSRGGLAARRTATG